MTWSNFQIFQIYPSFLILFAFQPPLFEVEVASLVSWVVVVLCHQMVVALLVHFCVVFPLGILSESKSFLEEVHSVHYGVQVP